MNRSAHRRLVTVLASVAALAGAGLLSGCGAGRVAATADIVPAVPGGNVDYHVTRTDIISVRDVVLDYPLNGAYPAGSSPSLSLRIANGTKMPIVLTGVSATRTDGLNAQTRVGPPAATDGVVQIGSPNASASASASPSPTEESPTPAAPSGKPRGSAEPSVPASPSPSASPTPEGNPTINIPIPAAPNGLIVLSRTVAGGVFLQIDGLTQALMPGQSLALVFSFSTADGQPLTLTDPTASVLAPVNVPANAGPRQAPSQPPTE